MLWFVVLLVVVVVVCDPFFVVCMCFVHICLWWCAIMYDCVCAFAHACVLFECMRAFVCLCVLVRSRVFECACGCVDLMLFFMLVCGCVFVCVLGCVCVCCLVFV